MRKILGILTLLLSMQVYAGTTESQVQDDSPESVELKNGYAGDDIWCIPYD